jgi:subtilisin family serine protease
MKKNITSKLAAGLMMALAVSFGCAEEEFTPQLTAPEGQSQMSANEDDINPAVRIKNNHYIIISSASKLPSDVKGQVQGLNAELTGLMEEVGIATATSSDPDFAAKASKINGVGSVIPDLDIQWYDPEELKSYDLETANVSPPSTGDSNPYYFLQWGHTAIQAPEAWNAGVRGAGVKVAVLDGGFYLEHPDLKDNIIGSASFVPGESAQFVPVPGGRTSSHGGHVAGTIAAVDNNIGVIGVAPEAQLLLVKVLADAGSGQFGWMLQGIMHAVAQDADVINMSLGAYLPRNGKFLAADGSVINNTKAVQELLVAITRVTNYAAQQGVTIISSAGNSAIDGNKDKSGLSIPAGAPNVISISSTAPMGWWLDPLTVDLDRVASYTNYGTPDVSFAAPGGDFAYPGNEASSIGIPVWALDMILSTGTATGYNWSAGTSMASPHATGVAALIIGQNGGKMSPKQVEAALRASADDLGKAGLDPFYGHGRVNAFKTIANTVQ